MDELVSEEMIKADVRRLLARPDVRRPLARLASALPPGARACLFGGAIRNLILQRVHGSSPETRDLDFVIAGLPPAFRLPRCLPRRERVVTEMGGIRWQPPDSPFSFDLCRLADFLVFRLFPMPPTLENLLANIDFSANAVIYDPAADRLYERGCRAAIYARRFDFNTLRLCDKLISTYRILVLSHKLDFTLSERVFHYLRATADIDLLITLKRALAAGVGKERAGVILAYYRRVRGFRDYAAYCAAGAGVRTAPEAG
ncbi:MAG: hypothetical protein U5J82_03550 [Desulfobacterales bacterium]|nr:hypothetical protein [Desulfobacterales bacterium]